ncbi:MAG: mannosyltransferase, partial [Actinobacteria bacterium]|nr:mannosyltransferase [Actinomycetota bacterium]
MRVSSRVVILLAIFAALVSYTKFNFCVQSGWQTPGQYVHACYSDISALYGDRSLDKGVWAYSSGADSVEYPVVQGTIMWLTAKVIPRGLSNYFYGSAILLALLF